MYPPACKFSATNSTGGCMQLNLCPNESNYDILSLAEYKQSSGLLKQIRSVESLCNC